MLLFKSSYKLFLRACEREIKAINEALHNQIISKETKADLQQEKEELQQLATTLRHNIKYTKDD